ncbi:LysR family transcriptional regulator [Rhizobium sp. Leaf341]|uniref:LysR family transcriptional regulator n=1 Tax=Rhizobium sp. Leaf341 TaxID=1736344 RepID=UPI00071352F2|nr:LysR family transcriptional regulator [Rhizobium sp. Leaf341]KQR77641.1 LysR family transcriptional regulator [Rhizobium sp. Leaf341]
METLANLESFIRSAEHGSFSEAARRMSLTPAAVSRNVAMLERNLGIRLFHRSTRKLVLTEAGESFRSALADSLETIQAAIGGAAVQGEPTGVLKVSLPPTLGVLHILPHLPEFLELYPGVMPEFHFDPRPVDLIVDGYDAAIGGGFDLNPGIVTRTLAPAHIIVVAAPRYMAGRVPPLDPTGLKAMNSIVMRLRQSGRIRQWTMRDAAGRHMVADVSGTLVVDDPAAMLSAAVLGVGVALVAKADAQPHLEAGRLVRLLPQWYSDAGAISVYYASRSQLPAKTRVFIDFVTALAARDHWPEQFAGSLG